MGPLTTATHASVADMKGSEDLAIAIEDARVRHSALVDLVLAGDQKASALLSLYVTIGVAAASGAAAGFAGLSIPPPLVAALLTTTLAMVAGAGFCLAALRSAPVNLPGRDAEFWLWALDHDGVDLAHATRQYLGNLAEKGAMNRALNLRMDRDIRTALWVGVASPVAALAAAGLAALPGL